MFEFEIIALHFLLNLYKIKILVLPALLAGTLTGNRQEIVILSTRTIKGCFVKAGILTPRAPSKVNTALRVRVLNNFFCNTK